MKFRVFLIATILLFATVLPLTSTKAGTMTSIPCPVCHMPMTRHAQGMMTIPLMVHGVKYYCCPVCAAGKKAAEYDKAHPGHLFVAEK